MSGPLMKTRIPRPSAKLFDPESAYGKRISHLSARIFGEVATKADPKSMRVVEIMSAQPWEQREDKSVEYFPNLPMFHYLTKMLRMHGLFYEEHIIWRELQDELRIMNGKVVRPVIGAGKKSQLKKNK